MKKQIEITIEQARQWYNLPECKQVIESNFTQEELFPLERKKKWDDILPEYDEFFYIDKDGIINSTPICLVNSLPSEESCKRETARMQAIIIADYYNDGWKADWKDENQEKWVILSIDCELIIISYRTLNTGFPEFKTKELAEEALENNREIFEAMF